MPVITPLPTPIEKNMIDMLEKLERLNSLKSDHELWQEKDKYEWSHFSSMENILFLKPVGLYRNLAKNKKKSEDTDPDLASRQTSQDYEDACNEELAKFTFSPRTTGKKPSCVWKENENNINMFYFLSSCWYC